MRVFNLAEELEKERKKNKELEFKVEDLKEQVDYQDLWRKEYLDRIDSAINYIENNSYTAPFEEIVMFTTDSSPEELLEILRGDNK